MKRDPSVTWRHSDPNSLNLNGLNVAVIGGTGGIGRALSLFMASRGARVIVVGRTFRDPGVPGIEFVQADLSLMVEALRIGKALPAHTLDLVVFTTGIFAAPKRQETSEGIERDMAVSYLSRLVILRAIAPRLGESRPARSMKPRMFIMGYPGTGQAGTLDDLNSEKSYKAFPVHMNTVAGNEVLVLDSITRYPHATFFGLNPGLQPTDIRSNFLGGGTLKSRAIEWVIGLLSTSPETYAARITPLLVSADLEPHSGAMFDQEGKAILPSAQLRDASYVQAFVEQSEALVAGRSNVRVAELIRPNRRAE